MILLLHDDADGAHLREGGLQALHPRLLHRLVDVLEVGFGPVHHHAAQIEGHDGNDVIVLQRLQVVGVRIQLQLVMRPSIFVLLLGFFAFRFVALGFRGVFFGFSSIFL